MKLSTLMRQLQPPAGGESRLRRSLSTNPAASVSRLDAWRGRRWAAVGLALAAASAAVVFFLDMNTPSTLLTPQSPSGLVERESGVKDVKFYWLVADGRSSKGALESLGSDVVSDHHTRPSGYSVNRDSQLLEKWEHPEQPLQPPQWVTRSTS